MTSIEGSYQHVKNENFISYLTAQGVDQERAKKLDLNRPILKITVEGKKITLSRNSSEGEHSATFVLDEEVIEKMPPNLSFKSTAKLNGNTLTITSKSENGTVGTRIYEFSGPDVMLSVSSDDSKVPSAKRYYKKL